ncbi:MAG: hypothetical protein OEZ10_13065 [Gammaproteobacteria bacterium]|nr:hypothetical protein [Gammaproteobacteria bacterium]
MKKLLLILLVLVLASCISGPPHLNSEQLARAEKITVFEKGKKVQRPYQKIQELSSADCSSVSGYTGEETVALFNLKKKAVYLGADAIINMSCGTSPLINDCWAPKTCSGIAIKWN